MLHRPPGALLRWPCWRCAAPLSVLCWAWPCQARTRQVKGRTVPRQPTPGSSALPDPGILSAGLPCGAVVLGCAACAHAEQPSPKGCALRGHPSCGCRQCRNHCRRRRCWTPAPLPPQSSSLFSNFATPNSLRRNMPHLHASKFYILAYHFSTAAGLRRPCESGHAVMTS